MTKAADIDNKNSTCRNWKSLWQDILFYLVYGFMYTISLLPLELLYFVSDFIYLVLYKVVGYRVRIVRQNLAGSFPGKSEHELRRIERDFYHWLCDYFVETLKLTSMSEREMRRRMRFEGLEQLHVACTNGHSCSLYLGHYCNWEWVSSLGIYLDGFSVPGQIYHPLENRVMDRILLAIRNRFRSSNISMEDAFFEIMRIEKEGKHSIIGYISDQVPGFSGMHFWPMFLNRQTPVYTGAERISRTIGASVFYVDIVRPRRGYYVGRFRKISDNAREEDKFHVTAEFFRMLETSINEHPAYWLWSHNRWKRTWEDFCKYFPDEKKRSVILSKL